MSIRFAASRHSNRVCMPKDYVRMLSWRAANDNGSNLRADRVNVALRHFAKHGLAAAQHAREQAIIAGKTGDQKSFEWWLDICRALDRRMARNFEAADGTIGG